jgi:hypothetical protein
MKKDQVIHSNDFNKRPFWFRTLNRSWKGTYFLGTRISLDKDTLIRTARSRTKLSDFGKDFSDEPLERLLWSIENEANLHAVGRFITRERLVSLLCARLRMEYLFKKHPGILEQELYPVWIIIGLQRTGTTKLQRLLAADPDHRWLQSWEAINPVPLTVEEGRKDKRPGMAKTAASAVRIMSPGFYAIHPIEYEAPEEDILLLDGSFMSTTPEATMNVPTYAQWLEKTDQSQAYAFEVKLLKLLQWQRPARRWILKSPHHLEFPDLVEKHFRDVHFLWTHRNIYESVPSFLSMVAHNRVIFSNDVDPETIARHWLRKSGYMLEKTIEYRKRGNNSGKFTDIFYPDLIADSIAQLLKVYQNNGGLTPALTNQFRLTEKMNPPRKYGIHRYSLEDFGITEADINANTQSYQKFLLSLHE